MDYDLAFGLLAHGVACFGTAAFWFLHSRRYWFSATGQNRTIPVFGLVAGAIGFAVPVVYFLFYADPAGFGIALLLVTAVTIATEIRAGSGEPVAPLDGFVGEHIGITDHQ